MIILDITGKIIYCIGISAGLTHKVVLCADALVTFSSLPLPSPAMLKIRLGWLGSLLSSSIQLKCAKKLKTHKFSCLSPN